MISNGRSSSPEIGPTVRTRIGCFTSTASRDARDLAHAGIVFTCVNQRDYQIVAVWHHPSDRRRSSDGRALQNRDFEICPSAMWCHCLRHGFVSVTAELVTFGNTSAQVMLYCNVVALIESSLSRPTDPPNSVWSPLRTIRLCSRIAARNGGERRTGNRQPWFVEFQGAPGFPRSLPFSLVNRRPTSRLFSPVASGDLPPW